MPRVLLVEDDALICLILEEELTDRGYDVEVMVDAHMALTRLEEANGINIVLTDVNLPGQINGIQLAEWVTENRPNVLTMVMSGRYEAKQQLSRVGDKVAFFPKPFDVDEIDAHIRRALTLRP